MFCRQTAYEFHCPTRRAARYFADAGMPTYLYHFTHVPIVPLPGCIGACHASEMVYMFGFTPMVMRPEQPLSAAMNTFWASFAKNHVPTAPGAPKWRKYKRSKDNYLQLDVGDDMKGVTGVLARECDVWDALHEGTL